MGNRRMVFLLLLFSLFCSFGNAEIRVVSLSPSVTHAISLMGGKENLVGCTAYCSKEDRRNVPIVSTLLKASIEKIVSLKPNIVFSSPLCSKKDIRLLQSMGIKVVEIPTPKSFAEIGSQFREIASYIGREKEADKILSSYTHRIDTLKKIVEKHQGEKKKVLFQVSIEPIYVALPETYLGEMLSSSGGENIASSNCYAVVGREFIVAKNPDAIFISADSIMGKREINEWNKFSSMKAVREENLFLIDPNLCCIYTLDNYFFTLKQMVELLYRNK
ncbi:MAG TPA: hypothetical protein DDY68_00795 [Porphyromonadaceae bacterium]|nr:hypothetical protein [Porphyromonadaceae bacterium]